MTQHTNTAPVAAGGRVFTIDAPQHIGQEITLKGWVHRIRKMGAINFIVLRDKAGLLQAVAEGEQFDQVLHGLLSESVVALTGTLVAEERAMHGCELRVREVEVLSRVTTEIPIQINKKKFNANLDTILDHRTISLREPKIRSAFKIQATLARGFAEYLHSQGFTRIFTPKIVCAGAEGGSNIFKVDYFGRDAYLTQSPQFYKQIMVGVFERVFEIGQVFRAEEHNTARHLNEYVSLDFEMGFIESFRDITAMENALMGYMMGLVKAECGRELALWEATVPDVPAAIPHMKLREVQEILEREYKKKCLGEPDLDPEDERLICQYAREKLGSDFLFVSHFPSGKRPFYAMDDPADPGYTLSFDLLFRGLEITTGGQRIHLYDEYVAKMQRRNMNVDNFQFYLEAFKYGMPPHGGLAIGLERITAKILEINNIREATLFPRDLTRLVP